MLECLRDLAESTQYNNLSAEDKAEKRKELVDEFDAWSDVIEMQKQSGEVKNETDYLALINALIFYSDVDDESDSDWLKVVTFLDEAEKKLGSEKMNNTRDYPNLSELLEFALAFCK